MTTYADLRKIGSPRHPVAVGPVGTPYSQLVKALNDYSRKLAAATAVPQRYITTPETMHVAAYAPQLKRGDKVRVEVEAYVKSVDSNGLITVADSREPFDADTLFANVHPSSVTRLEAAPQPVKVGDTISGDRIRETPWKRGTIVALVSPIASGRWVLKGDGRWVDLDTGSDRSFGAFGSGSQYLVEYAPGKAVA